jgi:serine/threonine-protein kinase
MPLSAGDKLGPYEILSAIGAGGMGQVYKARDTRLDRTVAIKVLPDHIAKREDLKARFEREARAVASLNHPNICVLYDIGSQNGTGFMVMEFMEGETLAARIEKGALPLDQALKFAVQIADALDRAHRAGVTHRDVKPQNIMLTRDGVKVLDFGLAKSSCKPGPAEETLTAALTTEGTVMGTPQYMAPEQFEGKEADARSDIWAFGAVLYEMANGRKAFEGKSYSSLVAAILSADPAPMAVKPFTPSWLERLVRRCLAKDPEDRWQTMRDIVIELRTPPEEAIAVAPAKARWWPWALAGAFALAFLVAGIALYNATPPAPLRPLIRLDLNVPPATPLARVDVGTGVGGNLLAISPDGARLAFALRGADGKTRLHTRLLQQSQVAPLAGTEGASGPFFSPDGEWIGFFADGKLKKIAVEGSAAVTLCDAPTGIGASWGDDGNIIAALEVTNVLSRIPSGGGTPVPVTKLNTGEATHRWPQVLPGSQAVLFTAHRLVGAGYDDANIELLSLRTGERKTLHRGGFYPRYLAAATGSAGRGHIVFLHQSTLFAVPFQAGSLALAGAAAPILNDVSSTQVAGGDFAFAANGTFVYVSAAAVQEVYPISWVDGGGKTARPLHASPSRYATPRFSPDGKRLAFAMATGKRSDIWVKDLARDTASRLSFLPGYSGYPVWTPDGRNIVFSSTNQLAPGLYAVRADGSGAAKRLTEGALTISHSFSPDGKRLLIRQPGNAGSFDIFTMAVEADERPGSAGLRLGKEELFLETPFVEGNPRFSPDGQWIAYTSTESGNTEVYVRPASAPGDRPGGRWQVSTGGGLRPVWSPGGRELLYVTIEGRVMAAGYTAKGDTFEPGKPRLWTEIRLRNLANVPEFDIAPDGKRLAAMVADDKAGELPSSLTVLLNFGDEVRRKAPAGN